jgi:hypothetical protein
MFGLTPRDRLPHERFVGSWIQACAALPGWQLKEPAGPGFDEPDFTRDEWRGMGLGALPFCRSAFSAPR